MRQTHFRLLLGLTLLAACFLHAVPMTQAQALPVANTFHTGSGNFQAGQDDAEAQMQTLKAAGADTCRVICYQDDYGLINGTPHPERLDATIALAEKYGLKPILLFENYGQADGGGWGTYDDWQAAGDAFARHFGSRILLYTAFNEPDGINPFGCPSIPPTRYHDCLAGLSDGVKGVDPSLKVAPGGFCVQNSMSDFTCGGYLAAVADLFNGGALDAIDLHTYTNGTLGPGDSGPAPLDLSYNGTAAQFSAQNAFDGVKATCGIASDPAFLCTEFNYASPLDPADGARGFLTAFFDVQGVVGDDGATRKTLAALVWQIQTLDAIRLHTLSVALSFQGAQYTTLNPSLMRARRTGLYALSQGANSVYVWHNRPEWSTMAGSSVTLPDVPVSLTHVDVWDAAGPRPDLARVLPVIATIIPSSTQSRPSRMPTGSSRRQVTLNGLPADQTLIFVIH